MTEDPFPMDHSPVSIPNGGMFQGLGLKHGQRVFQGGQNSSGSTTCPLGYFNGRGIANMSQMETSHQL